MYSLKLRTTTCTPVVDRQDEALICGINSDTFIYTAHSLISCGQIDRRDVALIRGISSDTVVYTAHLSLVIRPVSVAIVKGHLPNHYMLEAYIHPAGNSNVPTDYSRSMFEQKGNNYAVQ